MGEEGIKILQEAWHDGQPCKMCGDPSIQKEGQGLLCQKCIDLLQDHYGQVCLKCGNHDFIKWIPENVAVLANKLKIDVDILATTSLIIIIPFKECPKCAPLTTTWAAEYVGEGDGK